MAKNVSIEHITSVTFNTKAFFFKGQFAPKLKFCHYLLTLMPMEGWMKLFIHKTLLELHREKVLQVLSQANKANGDQVSNTHTKKYIIKL